MLIRSLHSRGVQSSGGAGSEPVFNAGSDFLIFQDGFDDLASIDSTAPAFTSRYPAHRTLAQDTVSPIAMETVVQLITGRGGAGTKALRCRYGPGLGGDILIGTEGRLNSIGSWNGTLPQRAGPYTHFLFQTWIRINAGADLCNGSGGSSFAGIKGLMFWNANLNDRYESAFNRVNQTPSSLSRYLKGCNPSNDQLPPPYNTLYKTADGKALPLSQVADGNWHRVTYEFYCGNDPSGHFGWTHWFDGQMVYSDKDLFVGPGTPPDHYQYSFPITHHMVVGNFANNGDICTGEVDIDFDDWMAWTR